MSWAISPSSAGESASASSGSSGGSRRTTRRRKYRYGQRASSSSAEALCQTGSRARRPGPGKIPSPADRAPHAARIPRTLPHGTKTAAPSGSAPARHARSAASRALRGPSPSRARKGDRGRRSTTAPEAASHSSEKTAGPAKRDSRWSRYREGRRAAPAASARRTEKTIPSRTEAAGRAKRSFSSAALRRRSDKASGRSGCRVPRLISSRSSSGRSGSSSSWAGTASSFTDRTIARSAVTPRRTTESPRTTAPGLRIPPRSPTKSRWAERRAENPSAPSRDPGHGASRSGIPSRSSRIAKSASTARRSRSHSGASSRTTTNSRTRRARTARAKAAYPRASARGRREAFRARTSDRSRPIWSARPPASVSASSTGRRLRGGRPRRVSQSDPETIRSSFERRSHRSGRAAISAFSPGETTIRGR